MQPRANLVTAVAGVASQMLVEPLSDAISDNIVFPLMEKHSEENFNLLLNFVKARTRTTKPTAIGITKDAVVDALLRHRQKRP